MEHSTEILYNKTEVSCSAVHRFGSDALLLARFCEPRRSQKAADLCSGCGIVSLEWHDRGHRGPCAAVELQPEASALLQEAVAEQGIGHITPYLADLRTFREGEGQFDVCACNPPYFTAGPQSTDAGRATARHETDCTLEDVCACGFRLLKDGGKLVVVSPSPRHLFELKEVLYEKPYENKPNVYGLNKFDESEEIIFEYPVVLESQEDIFNLFTMTPYYYKTSAEAVEKLKKVDRLELTCGFSIRTFTKKRGF